MARWPGGQVVRWLGRQVVMWSGGQVVMRWATLAVSGVICWPMLFAEMELAAEACGAAAGLGEDIL